MNGNQLPSNSMDAMKRLPGEDCKRPWPPLIRMDARVKARLGRLSLGRSYARHSIPYRVKSLLTNSSTGSSA